MGFVIYYNYDRIKDLINSFKNEPSYKKTVYANNDDISETVKTMSNTPVTAPVTAPVTSPVTAPVTSLTTSSSDTDLFILLAASNH